MNGRFSSEEWEILRQKIIGLGDNSARKSYYPELQQRLRDLEQAEKSLQDKNIQLQTVLDAATETSIIATNRDGLITIFNRGSERMLGYAAEEMIGKKNALHMHLESEIHAYGEDLTRLSGQTVTGFDIFLANAHRFGAERREWTYVRKDGSHVLVELAGTIIHDAGNEVIGYLEVAEDITERKRSEEAVRASEELFRLLFAKSGDANFLIDDNVFIDCNEAALSLLRCSDKKQLLFAHPARFSPERQPDDRFSKGKADEMFEIAFIHGSHRYEWVHSSMDGREIPVEVMLTVIPWHGKKILHAALRDITDRKEKEILAEQLYQARKMESIGQLAGGVAHDFNNLLTPIIGFADLMLASVTPESKQHRWAKLTAEAAFKARDLTQQLLSFGRKQILDIKTVDLNQIIKSFSDILHRTIRENIEIELHLSPENIFIRADKTQLEQIIMNLAINAQDAITDNGRIIIETLSVILDDEYVRQYVGVSPGSYVMLVVSDTGCGMDRKTMDHIFEPFFSTKGSKIGNGLGLATVYGLVKQHGGNITVYSEIDQGTTFKIYFPAVHVAPVQDDPDADQETGPSCREATIMLVEDNDMVRGIVHELLSKFGFTVVVADDVVHALELAAQEKIDMLVTDVVMPKMNGPELYELLTKSQPTLKVLFMSGYTDKVIVNYRFLAEGGRFLQKPFATEALLAKVQKILDEK